MVREFWVLIGSLILDLDPLGFAYKEYTEA